MSWLSQLLLQSKGKSIHLQDVWAHRGQWMHQTQPPPIYMGRPADPVQILKNPKWDSQWGKIIAQSSVWTSLHPWMPSCSCPELLDLLPLAKSESWWFCLLFKYVVNNRKPAVTVELQPCWWCVIVIFKVKMTFGWELVVCIQHLLCSVSFHAEVWTRNDLHPIHSESTSFWHTKRC